MDWRLAAFLDGNLPRGMRARRSGMVVRERCLRSRRELRSSNTMEGSCWYFLKTALSVHRRLSATRKRQAESRTKTQEIAIRNTLRTDGRTSSVNGSILYIQFLFHLYRKICVYVRVPITLQFNSSRLHIPGSARILLHRICF